MSKVERAKEEITHFAKDVELEVKRITWPTRNEAIKSTVAVVIISGLFALFFAVTDYLFSLAIGSILS